jgi:hypothetical protein
MGWRDELNSDYREGIDLYDARFRWFVRYVFDGVIASPGVTEATARGAVIAAYNAQFPTGAVQIDPGIFFDAMVSRHGPWASLKTWIIERADFRDRWAESLIEGTLPPVTEMTYDLLAGNMFEGIGQPADLIYTETRETTPGPTFNYLTERRWVSASLGKTVRRLYTNTFDGTRVNVIAGDPEVV